MRWYRTASHRETGVTVYANSSGKIFENSPNNFIPEARTAIREGKLAGSTTFSQAAWTRGAVVFALKLAEGAGDLPERLDIPIMLATPENIREFEGWK